MDDTEVKHTETRYYHCPPDCMTPHAAESHGADHAAYGWAPQLDPRWPADVAAAYRYGYAETLKLKPRSAEPQA